MRVLMITPYPLGPTFGGVEAVAGALAPALARQRDIERLDVLTLCEGQASFAEEPMARGTHYRLAALDRLELVTQLKQNVQRVRRLCDAIGPDVVHAQGIHREGIVAVQLKLPSVVSIHGLIKVERNLRFRRPSLVQCVRFRLADRLYDLVLDRANTIISTSHYDLTYTRSKIRGRIVSIPNPVPDAFFKAQTSDTGQRVLFAGVLQPRKNLSGIVRAFAQVLARAPQAELRLIGPVGSEPYVARIKKEIETLDIGAHVKWLGHVSQEELISEYASCSLVTLFSQEETSPMALAQAMAIGKPVVASQVGGVAEMILAGENGYVVPKNDEARLADRTTELLLNRELRLKMGCRAKEIARERCHAEKVARQTVEAYQLTLEARRVPPATQIELR